MSPFDQGLPHVQYITQTPQTVCGMPLQYIVRQPLLLYVGKKMLSSASLVQTEYKIDIPYSCCVAFELNWTTQETNIDCTVPPGNRSHHTHHIASLLSLSLAPQRSCRPMGPTRFDTCGQHILPLSIRRCSGTPSAMHPISSYLMISL